jgi:hypothetical protein
MEGERYDIDRKRKTKFQVPMDWRNFPLYKRINDTLPLYADKEE